MRHRKLISLPLLLITAARLLIAASTETGKVRIHVTDQFGNGLGPVQVTRFTEPKTGGRTYADRFVGAEANGIPYGEYLVQVRAGSAVRGGRVQIDRPENFIVLSGSGVFIDFAPNARPVTPGRVMALPAGTPQPVWIRIVNLYQSPGSYQTLPVGDDGAFSAGLLESGSYYIAVLDAKGVLFSGTLMIKNFVNASVVIDLAKGLLSTQER
jgi:hypothetical protein